MKSDGAQLLLVVPNLRGDDVSELQAMLARIGFDPGRADGIFGPSTARALEDFQHNSGLYVDGVCGPDTVRALAVLARQTGSGPGVSVVRELATLTASARSRRSIASSFSRILCWTTSAGAGKRT